MKRITAFLIKHKVFIFLVFILAAFVGKINDDYVYQDAFRELGENNVYVTSDTPIKQEIILSGKKFRSILLNIAAPAELSGEYTTVIHVYSDKEEIYTKSFSNDTLFEINDYKGCAAEFVFDNVTLSDNDSRYFLEITSDSPVQENSYGFGLTLEGTVWNRTTYLLFTKDQRKIITFFAVLLFAIPMYTILFQKDTNKWIMKPENIFIIMSIPLCILYLILVPIFQVPDEVNHYVRSYGIIHGYFLVPPDGKIPIPENLIPFRSDSYTPYILFKNFIMQIDADNVILHNNVNMALYSPVSYIFQSLGVALGEVLTHNTYVMVICGSIVNAIGCTVIIYYAIKYIPYGKGILLFLALTPMSLQERASLSVDAITFAAALAVLAYCLYLRAEHRQMNKKQLILIYAIMMMMASCKVIYFIMAGLVLIIPRECFGSKKKSLFHKAVILTIVLSISMGWLIIAGKYLQYTRGGGGTSEKLLYIINQPGRYLYIMDKVIWQEGVEFLNQLLGSKLGSLNISVNGCLIIGLMVLLCWFVSVEKVRRRQPDYLASLFMAGIGLGTIFLIFTSLYIQWTDIGASTYDIEGLQGRYFLPTLPYFLCAFISMLHSDGTIEISNKSFVKSSYTLYFFNLLVLVQIWEYSSFI